MNRLKRALAAFAGLLATQAAPVASPVPKIHLELGDRQQWGGLMKKRWLGHKQTRWAKNHTTGRLEIVGHDRHFVGG